MQCQNLGYNWQTQTINFDTVGYGLLSLFVLSTVEGYPDYMALNMDAADDTDVILFSISINLIASRVSRKRTLIYAL